MRRTCSLFRHQQGSLTLAMGVILIAMIGAVGMAVDMGRLHMVQARLSSSLDAAGLAAGAAGSNANVSTIVTQYMAANFPAGYMGATLGAVNAIPANNNMIINLSASASMNTTFLYVIGISTLTASASSQITMQSTGMELVLVLDNTGSMNAAVNSGNSSTTKMSALKTAANDLLNILYGSSANTVPNLWVGMVPFTQAVNIGTGYPTWMNTSYAASLDFGPKVPGSLCPSYSGTAGTYHSGPTCAYTLTGASTPNFGPGNWSGCVMARPSPYDITDDTPSPSVSNTLFQAYWFAPVPNGGYNYNPWETSSANQTCSHGRCSTTSTTTTYNYSYSSNILGNLGPNALCPQPVTPMVAEKSTIVSAINSMVAGGDTDLDLGMVWGWRMLSPHWQGMWGGEMNANSLPLAYNTPLMSKVVVFMTDGMNRFVPGDYSGYGFLADGQLGTTDETTAESTLDTRTLDVCTSMKNEGIIIYTIGFGTPGTDRSNDTEVNEQLLQSCATDANHFFLAPTNADLVTAFQSIGNSLANLRVSQ